MRYSGRDGRDLLKEVTDIIFFDNGRKECYVLEHLDIHEKTITVRGPNGKLKTYDYMCAYRMKVVEKMSNIFEKRYKYMNKPEKELFQKVLTGLAEVVMKHNPTLAQ